MSPVFDESSSSKKEIDRDLAEGLVGALASIDRTPDASAPPHPLAALIEAGPRSIDKLLATFDLGDEVSKANALSALAHVLLGTQVREGQAPLRASLKDSDDAQLSALFERTLALAGDDVTLDTQLERLGSEDPAVVATAARLLGFGRYRPAVPVLKAQLSSAERGAARWIVWALGEIGDAAALPALEQALTAAVPPSHGRAVDCLIAIGKIGRITSIPQVMSHLVSVSPEQKDAAVRSLAMILDKNRDDARRMGALRDQLAQTIERALNDPNAPISSSTRCHMLLCLARLGNKLDESRTRRYLGVATSERAPGPTSTPLAPAKPGFSAGLTSSGPTPPRKPTVFTRAPPLRKKP